MLYSIRASELELHVSPPGKKEGSTSDLSLTKNITTQQKNDYRKGKIKKRIDRDIGVLKIETLAVYDKKTNRKICDLDPEKFSFIAPIP